MANGISEKESPKGFSSQLVQWIDGGTDEQEGRLTTPAEDGVYEQDGDEDEEEFENKVSRSVSILNLSSSFLLQFGTDVQNLLVSHLERLTDVLDLMQRRNHNRPKSVVSALAVLLQAMEDWRSQDQVLCNFFLDRKRDADYFLQHANALRLTLGPYRLPDFLAALCLSAHAGPEVLRSALRYGLSPDCRTHFRHSWDGVALSQDHSTALLVLYAQMVDEDNEESSVDPVRFGRLLTDAMTPQRSTVVSARAVDRLLGWTRMPRQLADELLRLTGRAVPTLGRLCRARIRARLHASWTLPHGIHRLDIPLHLKSYLDIDT